MYRNEIKNSWAVISKTLNKNKMMKDEPLTFKCNGRDLSIDKLIANAIANEFNRLFATLARIQHLIWNSWTIMN